MVFNISVNCPLFGKYRFEFLSALCANIIAIAHGAGIAWLSPTLLLLQSEDTPLASGPLDVNEASWLGSLLCVGGFAGNLGFGFIANRWGRKRALSLIAFPQMFFWIIVTFANDIRFLYAGRVLAGMTGGGCFVTIPLYISDIASKEIRGSLGSILMLAVNCGVLVGYSVGSYLPYTVVPKVTIIFPVVYLCLILFFPETPQFLLLKNNLDGAKASLCFYRNIDPKSSTREVVQRIEKEIDEMRSAMGNTPTKEASFKDFASKDALKGMLRGVGLVGVNIFSGIFLIVNYNATIFKAAGINIAPNDATLIVAVSQIAGTYLSTLIVERFRRKTLLILTTATAGLALTIMGTSTYLSQFYDMSGLSWLPVASLSFMVFAASSGYIPLTFVVMNEVIPRPVRPLVSSVCNAVLNTFAFASLKLLPMLIEYAGLHVVVWICASMCFLGVLFNAICIPETRGKLI